MHSDFPVILDACVLANPLLCDFYLRLAERPRLYLPRWSGEILAEVYRTQTTKFKKPYPPEAANHWREQATKAFPEAMVMGWEGLLPSMANHDKDRHVLAAAIKGHASVIVTFNLRHFPPSILNPYGIDALHPQDYLLALWSIHPAGVMGKLATMASGLRKPVEIEDLLIRLGKSVPSFSCQVLSEMGKG